MTKFFQKAGSASHGIILFHSVLNRLAGHLGGQNVKFPSSVIIQIHLVFTGGIILADGCLEESLYLIQTGKIYHIVIDLQCIGMVQILTLPGGNCVGKSFLHSAQYILRGGEGILRSPLWFYRQLSLQKQHLVHSGCHISSGLSVDRPGLCFISYKPDLPVIDAYQKTIHTSALDHLIDLFHPEYCKKGKSDRPQKNGYKFNICSISFFMTFLLIHCSILILPHYFFTLNPKVPSCSPQAR